MEKINKIYDWIKANWFLTILGAVGFIFILPSSAVTKIVATVFMTYILEQVAIMLYKNIIVFVMNDNKLKKLFTGDDGIFSKNETLGMTIFQTGALISTHLIVGLAALGIFFAA